MLVLREILERFVAWTKLKCRIQQTKPKKVFFSEREIWWSHLGANIGHEQDGKHTGFERPVLIIKKLYGGALLWALPLTTSVKDGDYYVRLGYEKDGETRWQWVILSQIRTISSKRLIRKIRTIPKDEYAQVLKCFTRLLQK